MRAGGVMAGLVSGLLLLTAAGVANAQSSGTQSANARSRAPAVSLTEAQRAAAVNPSGPSRLRFSENGRWGLDLNLNQPVGRERGLGDVEAGAYYRINPRLRVGAAAGLAEPEADPARAEDADRRAAPRFRLESIFRF